MTEYPQKEFYKLSEVCQYTDTQPYVLRFWESEFPQLHPEKSAGGQPMYRGEDIDLVCRIKQLLYEEEFTLAGARRKLEEEQSEGRRAAVRPARTQHQHPAPRPTPAPAADPGPAAERVEARTDTPAPRALPFQPADADTVPRQRYQDAIDEIDHLRLQLKEADKGRRRAEAALAEAEQRAEEYRVRVVNAGARIEQLVDRLS